MSDFKPEKIDEYAQKLLEKAGEHAQKLARETDLFHTSKSFRDNILTYSITDNVQIVNSTAPWSSYLEDGTVAHTISGKNGGYLHFFWEAKNTWITIKSVNHPGTSPKPYMSNAAKETEAIISKLWDEVTK